jgi:NADH dehydrogenase
MRTGRRAWSLDDMPTTTTPARPVHRPPLPSEQGAPTRPPRILIVGGGFVGLTLARRLQRRLSPQEAEVVLVDASPVMTYQPFLAEVAGGSIEPRHVSVPLRSALPRTRVVTGHVTGVALSEREIHLTLPDGSPARLGYDELVLAVGSVPHLPPVPGLADLAVALDTAGDAAALRDRILTRLDEASDTPGPGREGAATVVVIGGGYSGVEAVAELRGLVATAARRTPNLGAAPRFELLEATDTLLPELPRGLAAYAERRLDRAGIRVRLGTRVLRATDGVLHLSDGTRLAAGTVVCATGVRAHPLLGRLRLPTDPRGRLIVDATLQVLGAAHLWAAGDGAAVPDLARAATSAESNVVPRCGGTAQHAVRQARVLADNLVATLRGQSLTSYRHREAGSVATLGPHCGVATVYGVPLRGLPAWLVHRTYHLAMVPTWGRKVRVGLGWLADLVSGRDLAALPPGDAAESRTSSRPGRTEAPA